MASSRLGQVIKAETINKLHTELVEASVRTAQLEAKPPPDLKLSEAHIEKPIRADDWNVTLSAIEALDERVSKLEAERVTIVIDSVQPKQPIPVKYMVTLTGRNFSVPGRDNTIFVGSVRATDIFADSSVAPPGTMLQFVLPDIPGVTAEGTMLPIAVTNKAGGVGQVFVRIRSEIRKVKGQLTGAYVEPVFLLGEPVVWTASRSIDLKWRLDVNVTVASSYEVTARFADGSDWRAAWFDRDGNQLSTGPTAVFSASAVEIRDLRLRVTAGTTPNTSVTVVARNTETGNEVNAGPIPSQTLSLGSAPPTRQPVVVGFAVSPGVTIDGTRLTFGANKLVNVRINIHFIAANTYRVETRLTSSAGWLLNPPSGSPDVPATAGQNITVTPQVKFEGTAPGENQLEVRITPSGTTTAIVTTFQLRAV